MADEESRKIIHIDMDAFFASVEQRDDVSLRGKPVAVGSAGGRGVVAAASYEARKFGVYSAMSSKIAVRKCPDLIFVPPRFKVYKTVSLVIKSIFRQYTDLIEPLSLDEAYLDVTTNKRGIPSATLIAQQIKKRIKQQTELTASAGVSINKFLAKVASDMDKPDGLFVIPPQKAEHFVTTMAVEKIFGVGKVTAKKMYQLGISTGADLKLCDKAFLLKNFGKAGNYFYNIARAIDNRPVVPNRPRKSIGAESTFGSDYDTRSKLVSELSKIGKEVTERVRKSDAKGRTLTLKIKYGDFKQITRNYTTSESHIEPKELIQIAYKLFDNTYNEGDSIRLLGITISNLEKTNDENNTPEQLTISF